MVQGNPVDFDRVRNRIDRVCGGGVMKRYIAIPEIPEMPGATSTAELPHVGHVEIEIDGQRAPLNPRFDLANHSPDGFAWGYHGSGPAQLALAILTDAAGDKVGQRYYPDFKAEVIAKLPSGEWTLEEADVLRWIVERRVY